MKQSNYTIITALLGIVLGVLATVLVTRVYEVKKKFDGDYNRWRKLNLILQEVQKNYVDTIDMEGMTDAAVVAALAELDPHSVYLPPVELTESETELAGNFEGIGITFNVPNDTAIVLSVIPGAYTIKFEDMLAEVNESVSCYNCHANTPGELVVTHTYLADAMGADFASLNAETASCAQCHVEYYFAPETKAVTLPYSNMETMHPDSILAFFEEMNFADYTNPRTGVKQIKVQHPEFETYMGKGSVHAKQFSCADCHMEKATNADGKTYTSHYWVSPLASESIKASCAMCHPDLEGFVKGIQAKAEERTIAIGTKLEDLTNKLADAVASEKYTEDELNAIRALNRKGQFYWDFVFVENSEGAHNSRLTTECLDKAEGFINEALGLFK